MGFACWVCGVGGWKSFLASKLNSWDFPCWGWGLGLIPVIPGWGTEIQLAARTNKKANNPPTAARLPPALPTLLQTELPPRAQQALFFVFLSTALSLPGQLPE